MSANRAVDTYIASLDDEQTAKDSQVLIEMMQRISGHEPKMWNVGTIGFDTYHYKYDSGREGDGHVIGFYPRKGKITVYLMDGTARYSELLAKLGKHTTTGYCVYIKRLSDIELPILEQIVQKSYEYISKVPRRAYRPNIMANCKKIGISGHPHGPGAPESLPACPPQIRETPGVWIGSGLGGIDGLTAGDPVTGEQMRALFGCGLHPLGELRQQQLEGPR